MLVLCLNNKKCFKKNLASDQSNIFRKIKTRCSSGSGGVCLRLELLTHTGPSAPMDTRVWRAKTPRGWTTKEHGRTIARKIRHSKKVWFFENGVA
jgi:hypothetical protein